MTAASWPAALGPVICVVGARPNFMKMAPIMRAFSAADPQVPTLLVHTGQHYDRSMSDSIFEDLGLPHPDVNLEVGSGTHTVQTAEVMRRFEPVVDQHHPSCVLVVGDVNSTLACALVAAKKLIPVVHVEAGLRSRDRGMPEEINRVLTDQISDLLYTTEAGASDNLSREGIEAERVRFVGNVMIDSLLWHKASAPDVGAVLAASGVTDAGLQRGDDYGVVTLHRPSNVDDPRVFGSLIDVLCEVSRRLPLVFAMHPRSRANAERFGLMERVEKGRIIVLPPQGYLQMVGLMGGARVVLTDSGGLQEESTALGVPCITLRENTERPITVEQGTNILAGRNRDVILETVSDVMAGRGKTGRTPRLWDGHAAERIATDLANWLIGRHERAKAGANP